MMTDHDKVLRVSARLYRALLVVYPKEFRDAYGSQMVQVFRDSCREKAERGGLAGLAGLWGRTILDLASTAVMQRIYERGRAKDGEVTVRERRLAGIGLLLLAAPLLFVVASLLKYGMGAGFLFDPLEAFLSEPGRRQVFNLVSPVAFLGGLALAVAVNLYAVLRLNVGWEDGTLVSTVRLEVRFANMAVILVSFALLVILVGYAFLENFAYRY